MVLKISRAAYVKLSATLFGSFVNDGSLVTKKDPCRLMNINLEIASLSIEIDAKHVSKTTVTELMALFYFFFGNARCNRRNRQMRVVYRVCILVLMTFFVIDLWHPFLNFKTVIYFFFQTVLSWKNSEVLR
jgi:hypothetical protein